MIIFCNIRHLAHFIFCWDLKNKISRQILLPLHFHFFAKLCLRVSSNPGSNKGFADIKEIDFPRCCGWDEEQQINACMASMMTKSNDMNIWLPCHYFQDRQCGIWVSFDGLFYFIDVLTCVPQIIWSVLPSRRIGYQAVFYDTSWLVL